MTDEKIVKAIESLGYQIFQYDAEPEEIESYDKYCVYYPTDFEPQENSKIAIIQYYEFVFINETGGIDKFELITALEKTGLVFKGGNFEKMKKVVGGDIVISLTMRFGRLEKRVCMY